MIRRIVLIGLLLLIAAPIGFLWFEHSRGKAALARTQAALVALGEKLDITRIAPAAVAPRFYAFDDFIEAATALENAFEIVPPSVEPIAPGRALPGSAFDAWVTRGDRRVSWSDVGSWMTNHAAVYKALSASLEAPHRQPPVNYKAGFSQLNVPPYARFRLAVGAVDIAAAHAIRQGDFDEALAVLQEMQVIVGDLASQPLLISHLVEISCATIVNQRAWDLLNARPWSESQLTALQDALPETGLAFEYARTLEGERAIFLHFVNNTSDKGAVWRETQQLGTGDGTETSDVVANGLVARLASIWSFAWGDQALASFLQTTQDLIESYRAAANARSFLSAADFRLEPADENPSLLHRVRTPYNRRVREQFAQAARKSFRCDTDRVLLRTGIALQRFRLHYDRHPERLEELVPHFLPSLPVDRMNGEPLHYRMTPDRSFVLWSVGDNLRDDGADGAWSANLQTSIPWWSSPDRVWPQLARKPDITQWSEKESAKLEEKRRRKPTAEARLEVSREWLNQQP